MPELVVKNLHKQIGGTAILKGISFDVNAGEVVALLGHSGSGKTTILRSVAGLEVPDLGQIVISDRSVFDSATAVNVQPERRDLGLVFQSYALWPNKTVFNNVAYGLVLRKVPSHEIKVRVDQTLERLGLAELSGRFPHQLSGGQQQRVALARALAYRPPVLLLDEPLSNLDAKLREEARSWLRQIIIEERITALYVTHDQVEAMALADRMLLLHEGMVEQEGRPQDIYEKPNTALAANFMGSNNQVMGEVKRLGGNRGELSVKGNSVEGTLVGSLQDGEPAVGFIRVERTLVADGPGPARHLLDLRTSLYLGERWEHLFAFGNFSLRAWGRQRLEAGQYWVELSADDLWIYPRSQLENKSRDRAQD